MVIHRGEYKNPIALNHCIESLECNLCVHSYLCAAHDANSKTKTVGMDENKYGTM